MVTFELDAPPFVSLYTVARVSGDYTFNWDAIRRLASTGRENDGMAIQCRALIAAYEAGLRAC